MKAKKSLGQNFLKSAGALKKIILAGEIAEDEVILEIGPGKGALTEKILEVTNKVIAVEKDRELLEVLKEKFSKQIKENKLLLIEGDILEFDVAKIERDYKIIANIPYNITGAILKKFLTEKNQPKTMVLMVQHEVAKRILARDHKESILSISIKIYGTPTMIEKVPARYFSPAPKVDSAVIAIKNISREIFIKNNIDENKFWELVRAGFAHKRKILAGNLKTWNKKIDWESVLETLEINKKARAEDLKLSHWVLLLQNTHFLF